MLALFPLSVSASRYLQVIQKARIKAADARIGTISESAYQTAYYFLIVF